ncbi:MAG: hypothetical protein HRT61_22545 [Ekhidna sp.]|nr:hypothetical protein [Ekhidna sp.]
MNKSELITCLRNPHELSDEQLSKLEKVVDANPYFLSARLLLAKASKEKGHPKTKRRVASAAIYSTDRVLLKKYLSGDLFFLSQPPKIREKKVFRTKKKTSETPPTSVKESTTQDKTRVDLPKKERVATRQKTATSGTRLTKATPDVPKGGLDAILEELQRDMENLKNSRAKFVEVQKNIKTESEKDGVVDPTNESQGDTFSKSEENSAEQTATEEQDSVSLDKADSQVTKKSTVPEETDSKSKDKSIAQEALRAIAKAKQEVAEEDEAEKEKQLISEPLAEGPSDPFELDETIDDKPSEDQEIEVRSIEKESSNPPVVTTDSKLRAFRI